MGAIGAVANVASNAASGGIMSSLSSLFGPDSQLMKILGSEGMANLITGGSALMEGLQTGDMLDFQKNLATKADARTEGLYDAQMAKNENQMGAFDEASKIDFQNT